MLLGCIIRPDSPDIFMAGRYLDHALEGRSSMTEAVEEMEEEEVEEVLFSRSTPWSSPSPCLDATVAACKSCISGSNSCCK